MVYRFGPVPFIEDGQDVEPAVGIFDVIFVKIGFGGVDQRLFLVLADGAERRAVTAEGVVLYFDEYQEFAVFGDDIYLSLAGAVIPLQDGEPLFRKIVAGEIFPLVPDLFADYSHTGERAISIPVIKAVYWGELFQIWSGVTKKKTPVFHERS
jgi:hypothetical protein